MKYTLCLLLAVLTYANVQAQSFTYADTLRGSLSPLRDCYDVTYYELDVKIDTITRSITGSNMMTYKAVKNFNRLQIDLFENLQIDSIVQQGRRLDYKRSGNATFVEMGVTQTVGSIGQMKIYYSGTPVVAVKPPWDGGFIWSRDEKGNLWIAVACEGLGASAWWPNKDHLSDEPDSMLIKITVPKGLMDVSNGRLRNSVAVGDGIRYEWFVSYPINNYNVTFNIGKYEHFSDIYVRNGDTLTLDYWVMPYNLEKAKEQFKQVKPMLACHEKYFGPYPFPRDGYKLVETPYLGMEHQSAVAYGNKYLTGYSGWDISRIGLKFDYIIIHESGHEWWGNHVSMKDAADMWIHEGFCTYSEALYVECMFDTAMALRYVNARKASVDNKEPIIGPYGVNKEGAGDMYDKGMLMLNTIRYVINDDKKWFGILRGIQDEFGMKTTTTEEVVGYINKKAGKDLSPVFDQYLRYANIPELEYKIAGKRKNMQLQYRWKADVKNFNMPVRVLLSPDGFTTIQPTTEWQILPLNLKKSEEFKVDEEHFYIKVTEVK
jgi:aminopeptidase N